MVDRSDIEAVRLGAKKAQEAADMIHKYSETARELQDAGQTLSKLQSSAAELKGLSKLSTGFMMAGAGLDVALMFMGGETDPNELILKELNSLDAKVTGMWQDMQDRLDQLTAKLESVSADIQISGSLNFFKTLRTEVGLYYSDGVVKDLISDQFEPAAIVTEFTNIASALGSASPTRNPMTASCETFFGSSAVISEMARNFADIAMFAPMAYSLVSALRNTEIPEKQGQHDPRNDVASPQTVAKLFDEHCKAIFECCYRFIAKITTEENHFIHRKIEEKLSRNVRLELSDGKPMKVSAADPNPGRNPFHRPAQIMLHDLVHYYPGVTFWVAIGETRIHGGWNYVQPGGIFDGENHYYSDAVPHPTGKITVSVFWTRRPATAGGAGKATQLLEDGYKVVDLGKVKEAIPVGVGTGFAVSEEEVKACFKDYAYEHNLTEAIRKFVKEPSPIMGGIGGSKDAGWALRTNDYRRLAMWMYPTWNPLNEEVMSSETLPKFDRRGDEPKKHTTMRVTKTGSEGIVFALLW